MRGLYRFYEELALRFAELGYTAVAIDYFGRTAGVAKRGEDFPYREHVDQATQQGVQADIRAAVDFLRSPEGGSCRAIFTVGFCYGGVELLERGRVRPRPRRRGRLLRPSAAGSRTSPRSRRRSSL